MNEWIVARKVVVVGIFRASMYLQSMLRAR
jgi:hypothetical protein